jgi:hypothetical protein
MVVWKIERLEMVLSEMGRDGDDDAKTEFLGSG